MYSAVTILAESDAVISLNFPSDKEMVVIPMVACQFRPFRPCPSTCHALVAVPFLADMLHLLEGFGAYVRLVSYIFLVTFPRL